jgi:GNAT superfamily N-acetyltransferase
MLLLHGSNAGNSLDCLTFSARSAYVSTMRISQADERDDLPEAPERLPGTIRKLWIGEADLLRDHLLRLDPDSRRSRFGSSANAYFIEQYTSHALTPESIVHGYFEDGVLRAAAELRAFGKPFPVDAEAALSVERPWQNRGVGSALLDRAILAAQNRGIRTIQLNCLLDNVRMQAVAKKHEALLRIRSDGVVGEVVNPFPTPLSVLRELIADGHGMTSVVLDLQSRMLQTP